MKQTIAKVILIVFVLLNIGVCIACPKIAIFWLLVGTIMAVTWALAEVT